MLPDRVSNPGPLTYESGALPIALRGPAEICKGASFCTKIGGVMELVLSTLCDNALYLYQVLSKYLTGFQSYGPEQ